MILPGKFNCRNPYPNGFETEDDPLAIDYVEKMNEVRRRLIAGTLMIEFVDGDRKGSIARVSVDDKNYNSPVAEPSINYEYNRWGMNTHFRIKNEYMFGICRWDDRKNKVRTSISSRDIVVLFNYDGPTVWQKFDAKAAKDELLKTPNQRDIDGRMLAIGDEVLYVNIRYGSGTELCHGRIKEFNVSVNSKKHEISTIVENIERTETSSISSSEYMIWKK